MLGSFRRCGTERNPRRRSVQDGAVYSGVAIAVTVTLFADLRRLLPRGTDGPQRYTVREGATVSELLAAIGVEAGADVTVAVNGELAARDTPLREGAEVMVLSPMEGGAAGTSSAARSAASTRRSTASIRSSVRRSTAWIARCGPRSTYASASPPSKPAVPPEASSPSRTSARCCRARPFATAGSRRTPRRPSRRSARAWRARVA
ncbi:MAG: hypothetical protein DME15_12605 [Candidatus Rokuibacteriota bacterium]|nr:MAG: hypothetical protein DME15_12605 [Candidatus Rokubacteria bacterium]